MQTKDPVSHIGTPADAPSTSDGFLENPNRVVLGPELGQLTVYANGVATAVLEGHFNTLAIASESPPFRGNVMDFTSLYWTQTGALLRIQGERVLDILGPSLTVLRGKHRQPWDPRPGMNDVRVIVSVVNPEGLSPLEIFQLATRLAF